MINLSGSEKNSRREKGCYHRQVLSAIPAYVRNLVGPNRSKGQKPKLRTSEMVTKIVRVNRQIELNMFIRSIALIFFFFSGVTTTSSALAQEAQVKLEVTPATIDLPAKGEAQAQVVLRNKSQVALQNVKLDWFSGTQADITTDEPKELANLASQADTYWTLHVNQSANGLIPGNVYLRVKYDKTGTTAVSQVLYATLVVNSRQSDEVNKVVEIVPRTSSTQLNEQRPGQVFLVITNKGNLPINLHQITSSGPSFISGTPDMSKLPKNSNNVVQIEARDSAYVPVEIKVIDAVRPGKHLLLFQTPIEWGPKENRQKANVIAQQEFEVGILGESEMLTALGLPSFLILPGFLMIVMYGLLDKRAVLDQSILKNATNAPLWIGAITLSGLMAFLYPFGTKLLSGVRRDYLISYGLGDVIRVWIASILLGVVAWLIVQCFKRLRRYLFKPSSLDKPARLLRKLYWQGLPLNLDKFGVKINSTDVEVFLLERRRENQETYWVGPYINIEWPSVEERLKPEQARLKQDVAAQLDGDNPKALAKLIEEGEGKKVLTAQWGDTTGTLTRPSELKKQEVPKDGWTSGVIAKQI